MCDALPPDRLSHVLLTWYDDHARDLPWRVPPHLSRAGQRPDAYRIWLSEVMLQQTTVAAVKRYFDVFTTRWPRVENLAEAEDADVMAAWAGLGYYARARNLLKCARVVVADHGGRFPDTRDALQALPGIGPYTSAAIAAIAFGQPETVVDGNVERVMARLHAVETPMPTAKPTLVSLAEGLTPQIRPGDYAQAVMDLGATICTPKSPACGICPWVQTCQGRAAGIAADLPRKLPKTPQPVRLGVAYLARLSTGGWVLERRPDRGLLGGMLGWPGSDWAEAVPESTPPFAADWHDPGLEVRHTFTHFHLRLSLRVANDVPADDVPDHLTEIPKHQFKPDDLPTVMRKAFDLARPVFDPIETRSAQD